MPIKASVLLGGALLETSNPKIGNPFSVGTNAKCLPGDHARTNRSGRDFSYRIMIQSPVTAGLGIFDVAAGKLTYPSPHKIFWEKQRRDGVARFRPIHGGMAGLFRYRDVSVT